MRRNIILTVLMTILAIASAMGGTPVSSASATVTGPDGMSRNEQMSAAYKMDVFTDPGMTTLIALGEDEMPQGETPKAIATQIAKGKGYDETAVTVINADSTPVYVAVSPDGMTSIGVAEHPSTHRMVVAMVIQASGAAVSAPVLSTLRWK